MKKIALPAISLCMLSLLACHKDHVTALGTPTDTLGTLGSLKINLISSEAAWTDTVRQNVELIVSEPGGKVLIDTVTPANTHITTSLATNATTVDLTNIFYDAFTKTIVVSTFKGVNPSGWAGDFNLNPYAPSGPRSPTLVPDTLTYTHVPSTNDIFFSQNEFTGLNENETVPNTFSVEYGMLAGNYAYLICPTVAKYKMTIPTPGNQTIDCTTMDPAATANFSPSTYYTYYLSSILGYPDSTNLNSEILLYFNDTVANPGLPQLMYPTKNIQKYAVFADYSHGTNEYAQNFTCSNTVNPNITLPDPNSYTIGANQNTHFSLSWNAAKPTYYSTFWRGSGISYTLYASPDSLTLNPLGLLTAQKAKMLQGQDLTKLTFSSFQFETIQGYNYSGYLGLVCDSTKLWQNPITAATTYQKTF